MINPDCFFKEKIRAQSPCCFADFMHTALYDPNYGYYATKPSILGKTGDFITAPELTPLFGYTVAKQLQSVLDALPKKHILELGAGTGRLCVNILSYLETQHKLPERYYILEPSPSLRAQQQDLVKAHFPHFSTYVEWITAWPQEFIGAVVANEVLDAMPVHRFLWKNEQVLESFVQIDPISDQLTETFLPTKNQALQAYVQGLNLSSPYCSEVNLWLPGWLESLYHCMNQGLVLLIDYGYPRREYYHPDRIQGTIMCHENHRSHPDFLYRPGCQDITAHVDFTYVAETADALGFDITGYTHQAGFLLSNGILELLAAQSDACDYQQQAQQVKILLQAHEMGELFKVMALGKNFTESLSGFMMFDKRASL